MAKVRVGLVGLGNNGSSFVRTYAASPQAELVAVCDLVPEKLKRIADQYNIKRAYAKLDDMLACDDIDLISIHTPDPLHREPFVKALAAGKHAFVEKPFANTVEDAEAMVAAARQSDRKTMVGHILRFNPLFRKVHELASSGALGEIFYLEADYIHNLFGQADPHRFNPHIGMNWYLEKEIPIVGGGAHEFDLLRWYANSSAVEVAGFGNRIAFPQMKNPDCQAAVFKMESGAVAKVAALYGPVGPRPDFCNLEVYGTKGTVRQGKVYIGSGHDVKPQDLSAAQIAGHPYEPEVEHFLDCILHDKPPLVDAIEGANSVVGVLKAAESIQRGGEKLRVPVFRR